MKAYRVSEPLGVSSDKNGRKSFPIFAVPRSANTGKQSHRIDEAFRELIKHSNATIDLIAPDGSSWSVHIR
jgi:hypothetical protein